MKRFILPIVTIASVMSMVACSGRDPVADEANNTAAAPAEVDVLPPDESVATPTDELENGDDEDVNVNVAAVSDGDLHLRTFERGAGLTRACGTGACATAVAAIRARLVSSPVTVHMAGGSLTIAWTPDEPVRMRGSATHVFEGTIDLS